LEDAVGNGLLELEGLLLLELTAVAIFAIVAEGSRLIDADGFGLAVEDIKNIGSCLGPLGNG
jgi:hypothetical protein